MAATVDIYATQSLLPAAPTLGTLAVVLSDAHDYGGTGGRGLFVFLGGTGWQPVAQAVSTGYSPT
jgi:hypothetical protein